MSDVDSVRRERQEAFAPRDCADLVIDTSV
jgi:hypothetical protein